ALPAGGLPPGNPSTGTLAPSGLNPANVGTVSYGDRPAAAKDTRSLDLVLDEPSIEPPFENAPSEVKRQSMPLPSDPV
ncbi:MAG: hypothetical protein SNJ81_16195, partial [Cyanobacteriota bacterium]